ncbi:MAG: hypothetical protein N5P05_004579 [Chroococcopsis gigantea SAG 12.99]|jgi:hypothetical protein|nr:hypothetical protein [Chroococcopsis gigantea SAG 12.99]
MQVLNAYVNAVREVNTKYGPKIVLDCVAGHRECQIWRPAKDTHLLAIKSGSQVTVTCDSKGKYNLVDNVDSQPVANPGEIVKADTIAVTETTAPRSKADSSIPPETKKAIASYVQDLADLYGFCHQTAGTINGLTDNDRRQVATTLFIATKDKFSL